jgi:hypothetical protein
MDVDVRWKQPFAAIVAGPSGCGKTQFVLKFIKHRNEMCNIQFDEIIWYYSEWQPWFNEHSDITFEEGLPKLNFIKSSPKLIVIDDLMRESNSVVVDLFTKGCHHKNISVFFITQNLFHQSKGQRDISLNAHYIVYFKNPRDKAQIQHLARQLCPENSKFIQEAYNDATSMPHGYLVIDLKQDTMEDVRFRTSIFPTDQNHWVYVPKK